jgi:hypothetical protein
MTVKAHIAVAALSVGSALSSVVPLTLLTDPRATCMDGSLSGYYYEPSTAASDATKWVIDLQGGGECDREDACKAQLTTQLGSSKYFPTTSQSSGWYLASGYCPYNPGFCSWNHVRVPYCSQDLWSGTRSTRTDPATWGLYFSGHLILAAVLNELDSAYGLDGATDIILSGASAGGIGVWMNVDWLQQRYPLARVTAVTIAGFYFFATYYEGTNHTSPSGMGDFRESALVEVRLLLSLDYVGVS